MTTLYEKIIKIYPELENAIEFRNNIIIIQDDSDGLGDFIAKWEYSKPLPDGALVGKEYAQTTADALTIAVAAALAAQTPATTAEPVIEEPVVEPVVEDTTPTTAEPTIEETTVTE